MTFHHQPPSDSPISREISETSAKLAAVHSQNLETAFVAALTRHLGYLPTVEETHQHARIAYRLDGRREWRWDDIILMEERPAPACASGGLDFYLPEIVIP